MVDSDWDRGRRFEDNQGVSSVVVAVMFVLVLGFFTISKILFTASWNADLTYVTVLVGDEHIKVVGVDESEGRVIELGIDDDLMVPVVGMQGELKSASLWRFGVDEGDEVGVVERSVEWLLGVNVNGVWKVSDVDRVTVRDVLMGEGSVGFWQRLRILRFMAAGGRSEIEKYTFTERVYEIVELPDGSVVKQVQGQAIWSWQQEVWLSERIFNEGMEVVVNNGTGFPGMSRLVESMVLASGASVIDVEAVAEIEGWCEYSVDQDNGELFLKFLRESLKCVQSDSDSKGGVVTVNLGKEWGEAYSRN